VVGFDYKSSNDESVKMLQAEQTINIRCRDKRKKRQKKTLVKSLGLTKIISNLRNNQRRILMKKHE